MAVRKLATNNAPVDMSAIIAQAVANALAAQAQTVATATPAKAAKPKAAPATWISAEAGEYVDGDGKSYTGVWFTDSRKGRMFMGPRKISAVLAFADVCRKAIG